MLGFRKVAVLALAAVLLTGCSNGVTGTPVIPTTTAAPSAPSTVPVALEAEAGTVLVGNPAAKNTLEVYEDFLCPYCQRFEQTNADKLNPELTKGTLKIRYHLLNLLNNNSVPPGYSQLSANAALTVAKLAPQRFAAYHALLFSKQPEEGGPGFTEEQLVELARQVGVDDPGLPAAVAAKTYNDKIAANYEAAKSDPRLQQDTPSGKGFGTPAVLLNDKFVNWIQDGWLKLN